MQKTRRGGDIFEHLSVVGIMLMSVRYIRPSLGKIYVLPYRSLKSSWSAEMAYYKDKRIEGPSMLQT